MNALISVIIPIYNMEQYLDRCLDSVLNNTYRNLEVICIDDGSTDRSAEILRRYKEKDPRIVVITKENGGVSSARNAGLDRMTGEYLAFVDPDDLIHPQFFELLLRALDGKTDHLALCGFHEVGDKDFPLLHPPLLFDPGKIKTINGTQFFQHHIFRSFCGGRLIPANLLKGLRFREELRYSEDSVFFAELGERTPDLIFLVLDEQLYDYYQREDSLVRTAQVSDRLLVTEIFVERALASVVNDRFYLDQAVKRGLSTRYYASHIYPDRQQARSCSALLRSCLPALWRTAIYSPKQKAIYSAFIILPGLYWLFRSITEPYMWKWEKVERRKRREAKKDISQH